MVAPSVKVVGSLTNSDLEDLYFGELAAIHVVGAADLLALDGVVRRFWASSPNRRNPPAPGLEIGAHHFGKTLKRYASAVRSESDRLSFVLGPQDPVAALRAQLAIQFAESGIDFRAARWGGSALGPCVIRTWESEIAGGYLLGPHDDTAQLADGSQAGVEFQAVAPSKLIATNLCLARSSGAQIQIWNHRANDADRLRLGIEATGYPYPRAFLESFDSILIPMVAGDALMLKGEHVHAVRAGTGRLVASFFSGPLPRGNDVVYWS